MKSFKTSLLAIGLFCLLPVARADAQAEPDYNAAVHLLNLFEKQCFGQFPDFNSIETEASENKWFAGQVIPGRIGSWAVNEGTDNFSFVIVNNVSASTKSCEVRGKAGEETTVGIYNGLFAAKNKADRTGAPENSWRTPNGMVTIKKSSDGRTSAILTK